MSHPSNLPLIPNFEEAAAQLVKVAQPEPHKPVQSTLQQVSQMLRQLWSAENVACENLARSAGDRYHKTGREEKAEASWAVAGQIRLRREAALG